MADELSRSDVNFAKRLGREMAVSNARTISAATASSSSTVYRETAIVETVYLSEGTLDVNMGTSDLPLVCYAVPFTTACSGVQVGDTVIIETYGHRMVAVGIVATSSDPAYRPATQESVDKAITGSVTEYTQSQDHETAPTSGWSTEAPSYESGKYIWMRTVTTNGSGDTETTDPVVITGNPGPKGEGVPGTSAYVHLAYANSADGKTDFSIDDPTGRSYLGQYTDSSEDDSTDPTKYTWSLIKGAAGKGISSATVQYAKSTSGTTAPTSGWQSSIPDVEKGSYLWTKTTTSYTSGNPTTSYSVAYIAEDGTDGTSTTIKSATTTYQAGTSATAIPTGEWKKIDEVTVPQGGYLWSKTVVTYSDGTSTSAYGVSYSAKDGADGAGFAWNLLKGTAGFTALSGGAWDSGSIFADSCTLTQAKDASSPVPESTCVTATTTVDTTSSGLCSIGGSYSSAAPFAEGQSVTLSCYVKSSVAGTVVDVTPLNSYIQGRETVGTEWTKLSYSGAFPAASKWQTNQWYIKFRGVAKGTKVYICGIKLEHGTAATPWCTTQAETIGSDGASVSAVKIQYYKSTSSSTQTGGNWQDSVPDWTSGHYIWQRTQTTIGGKTVTGDPVLYGAFNSLATSVEGNSSKISQTANALGLTFGTSKATGTLIKADSTGIEVGQSTDGTNFASTHTKMGTSAFSIHDKSHTELATFGSDTVELGKNSSSAVIKLCKDTARIGYGTGTWKDTIGISGAAPLMLMSQATQGSNDTFATTFNTAYKSSSDSSYRYANAENTVNVSGTSAGVRSSIEVSSGDTSYGSEIWAGGASVAADGSDNAVRIQMNGGYVLLKNTNGQYPAVTAQLSNFADAIRPTAWKFSREAFDGTSSVTGVAGWTDLNGIFTVNQMGYASGEWFTVSSANCLTVVKPGIYRIKLQVFGEGATDRIGAGIYVGTTEASSTFYYCNGATIAAIAEHVCKLTKGTNVYLKGWGNNAGWKWRSGGQYTYVTVDYLGAI